MALQAPLSFDNELSKESGGSGRKEQQYKITIFAIICYL
jgi:hypothetical protein